jgi:hypothetical protein
MEGGREGWRDALPGIGGGVINARELRQEGGDPMTCPAPAERLHLGLWHGP